MTNRVGAAINTLLRAHGPLTALVGNKIFPVASQVDAVRPFIIYQRTGLSPAYTKDNRAFDSVFINITIISESYTESISILTEVENALRGKRGIHAGVNIDEIMLNDSYEEADEENYIQEAQFEIFINN